MHGVALEANYPTTTPRFAARRWCSSSPSPGGYGWVFPKGDHVNVGVGGRESEGPQLRGTICAASASATASTPTPLTDVRGHRLPMRRPGKRPRARHARPSIGDAAGLVDPFSGDGMYEALLLGAARGRATLELLAGAPTGSSRTRPPSSGELDPLASRRLGREGGVRPLPAHDLRDRAAARSPSASLEKLLRGELAHPGARARAREGLDPADLGRRRRGIAAPQRPKSVHGRSLPLQSGRMELNALLGRAVELGASDIHLKVGQPPILRRDGDARAARGPRRRSTRTRSRWCSQTIGRRAPEKLEHFHDAGDLDIAYQDDDLPRFRVNAYRQRGAISFAFRVIPKNVPSFEQLGPARRRAAGSPRSTAASSSSPARPARERRRRSPR